VEVGGWGDNRGEVVLLTASKRLQARFFGDGDCGGWKALCAGLSVE
jgi:hypothetical protein